MADGTLRVLPLGGLGEIGKNMTVFEYDDRIVVVDVGLRFPTAEMVGIDLVVSVGTDQQQMTHRFLGQQIFEQMPDTTDPSILKSVLLVSAFRNVSKHKHNPRNFPFRIADRCGTVINRSFCVVLGDQQRVIR